MDEMMERLETMRAWPSQTFVEDMILHHSAASSRRGSARGRRIVVQVAEIDQM